ncbi:unnamed protein product [Discosporangium mesarthrocarpum]
MPRIRRRKLEGSEIGNPSPLHSSFHTSTVKSPRELATLPSTMHVNTLVGVEWPAGLKELYFGTDFNEDLHDVNWPDSLEVVSFGPFFDKSVDRVEWPTGLQRLSFGHSFNQAVEGAVWPAGLQQLSFGHCFDQVVDRVVWPESLRQLSFGKNFVGYEAAKLLLMRWPSHLEQLVLGERCVRWPAEVQERILRHRAGAVTKRGGRQEKAPTNRTLLAFFTLVGILFIHAVATNAVAWWRSISWMETPVKVCRKEDKSPRRRQEMWAPISRHASLPAGGVPASLNATDIFAGVTEKVPPASVPTVAVKSSVSALTASVVSGSGTIYEWNGEEVPEAASGGVNLVGKHFADRGTERPARADAPAAGAGQGSPPESSASGAAPLHTHPEKEGLGVVCMKRQTLDMPHVIMSSAGKRVSGGGVKAVRGVLDFRKKTLGKGVRGAYLKAVSVFETVFPRAWSVLRDFSAKVGSMYMEAMACRGSRGKGPTPQDATVGGGARQDVRGFALGGPCVWCRKCR